MKLPNFKLSKKEKIILIFIIVATLKLFSSPLLLNLGNYFYENDRISLAKISYVLSWPAINQQDSYHYNMGQANYAGRDYISANNSYSASLKQTDNLQCEARIQYVNSDLRQIEAELNNGRVLDFKDRILDNIKILEECLLLDNDNIKAAKNIAVLKSILETSESTQKDPQQSDQENTSNEEQEVVEQDIKRQLEQREFIDQDTKQPVYDFSGPNW